MLDCQGHTTVFFMWKCQQLIFFKARSQWLEILYLFFSPKRSLSTSTSQEIFIQSFSSQQTHHPNFTHYKHSCETGSTASMGWWVCLQGLFWLCSITNQSQLFSLPNNLLVQSFYYTICAYCIQISQEKKQVPRNLAARNKRAPVSRAQMRKNLGVSFS